MLKATIAELWRISRTALATQDSSRHSRMTYVKKELINNHPELVKGMTNKQIWLEIEDSIN